MEKEHQMSRSYQEWTVLLIMSKYHLMRNRNSCACLQTWLDSRRYSHWFYNESTEELKDLLETSHWLPLTLKGLAHQFYPVSCSTYSWEESKSFLLSWLNQTIRNRYYEIILPIEVSMSGPELFSVLLMPLVVLISAPVDVLRTAVLIIVSSRIAVPV
jgi:hypothetical protein